jgi:hypothetical protein
VPHLAVETLLAPSAHDTLGAAQSGLVARPSGPSACRILLLYSGCRSWPDGSPRLTLKIALGRLGYEADEFDILHGEAYDLSNDMVWDELARQIAKGAYAFVFASPPCSSASVARHNHARGPGPGPVRSLARPWGLPGLSPSDKELVRVGNLHVLRTCAAAEAMLSLGRGYAVENPEPWEGLPSLFHLDPLQALLGSGGADVSFRQCAVGAASAKPTRIRFWLGPFASLGDLVCNHPPVVWTDADGTSYTAPHRRLVGREPGGGFGTSKSSAYPDQLNCRLAECIVAAVAQSRGRVGGTDFQ